MQKMPSIPSSNFSHDTIMDTIGRQAEKNPLAAALISAQEQVHTYHEMMLNVSQLSEQLSKMGIHRGDRVAVALPNSPELAMVFLGVSAIGACAPLYPGYSKDEFMFYLADVKAKTFIIEEAGNTAAEAAAQELAIPVIRLAAEGQGGNKGPFLIGDARSHTGGMTFAMSDDTALIIHTSGTTSRPKMVPLTHKMINTSLQNTARAFRLTAQDRCLNTAPLFHTHGLVIAVLASLATGGSVVICANAYDAELFFHMLETMKPTWYTAAPTVHQNILRHALATGQPALPSSLRFIRSAAAALAPALIEKLEDAFGVPVIETYGMTEASSQIASNPLPPEKRKLGSVGKSNGCEIQIVDQQGCRLPPNETGEIILSGNTVLSGYENNPQANRDAFHGRWFKSGDQGYFDDDGYLFITGRSKEIINRGGQKVSPQLVDECLLEHPCIAEAAAFALSHPKLGEDVAAAVVFKPGREVQECDLRRFLLGKLAFYKVPSRFFFVDALPKGSTGKIQRALLAEQLGIAGSTINEQRKLVTPRNEQEEQLIKLWEEILETGPISVTDDFFQLGGDSLAAVRLLTMVEERWGQSIPLMDLFEGCSVEKMALLLAEQEDGMPVGSSVVPIQLKGSNPILFCVHPIDGKVVEYVYLSKCLGDLFPVYGLRFQEVLGNPEMSIESLARRYVRDIRAVQPQGPYYLAGHSLGGLIAFEMAQQLRRAGQEIALLALFDTRHPNVMIRGLLRPERELYRLVYRVKKSMLRREEFSGGGWKEYFQSRAQKELDRLRRKVGKFIPALAVNQGRKTEEQQLRSQFMTARRKYQPALFPGKLTLFCAADQEEYGNQDQELGWSGLAEKGIDVYKIPGDHRTLMLEPQVSELALRLEKIIKREEINSANRKGRRKIAGVE
ncbi:MAG: AMP-dependent synthetase [Firmicutes bacterium]|nr:AMP-dependent synthetase [Bacillota bacterium]